jgi:hypothetical protein
MMCNSVSLSVATWKFVTENPSCSEPQENEGAEEPELEALDPEPEREPEADP